MRPVYFIIVYEVSESRVTFGRFRGDRDNSNGRFDGRTVLKT
jgi:hypothetical protein